MKIKSAVYSILIIFLPFGAFSQQLNKLPEKVNTQNEQLRDSIAPKALLIPRPEFSLKNTTLVEENPEGKITPTGTHWYALEKQNDSVYWANVDCKKIGSTTNLMENATLVVKRSYVFRTVI